MAISVLRKRQRGLLQPMFLRLLTLTVASVLLVNPTSAQNTLSAATSPGSTGKKPNIVLILTDDQSWDSFGFMGGKVHTPRLNQMMKDGIYLSNFNVTSTVCSPSRYSFLTGRYAGRCEGQRFLREHPLGDQTPAEKNNIFDKHPQVAALMKRELAKALVQFEHRPFGEFTEPLAGRN